MTAPMNAPRSMRCPLRVQPTPFPAAPPPAIALTSGVMMLSVKDLISVLNARATTRPTAMTTRSPCMRKFLKPFSTSSPLVRTSPWLVPSAAAADSRPWAARPAGRSILTRRDLTAEGEPRRGQAVFAVQQPDAHLIVRVAGDHAGPLAGQDGAVVFQFGGRWRAGEPGEDVLDRGP